MAHATIIGVGPGIGLSVARRFAREGFSIGMIARTQRTLDDARAALGSDVDANGLIADAADEDALRAALALEHLTEQFGVPDVLVYNAGLIQMDALGDLTIAQQQAAWAINVGGVLTAAAHLLPRMAAGGGGTFVITGGMPSPYAGMVSLSLGKATVRSLTELLADQFGPAGVHVATVTVGGRVEPGGAFDPDEIAEVYWRLYRQSPVRWEREVSYTGVVTQSV